MTTEQAADRLGALAVSFPRMKPAMQSQLYAQLRADEQEAVRVLFGYGESEEQPAAPAPATATPTDELIAALQRFAATARRAETTTVVVNDSPASQTPTTPNSVNVAAMLRELAEEIERRQAPITPKAPEAKQRQRVGVSRQLASAQATRLTSTHPLTSHQPSPRPKLLLPPLPIHCHTSTSAQYPYGMTKESYDRVQRAGLIAMIQAIAFIVAVILFPILLVWAVWE